VIDLSSLILQQEPDRLTRHDAAGCYLVARDQVTIHASPIG
jgi:hypothetical protein